MRHTLPLPFHATVLLAAVLAPAAAQTTYVSPSSLGTAEGTQSSSIPFDVSRPIRYMQIHTDTTGRVMNISRISFRQNGTSGTFNGVRALSLELYLGHSRQYDHIQNLDFLANYTTTRTRVINRRSVNFGPEGTSSPGGGSSFTNLHLAFDQNFAYDGRPFRSLAWEVLIFSSQLTGTFNPLDAEIGKPATTAGTVTVTGAGCTASGRTTPMTQALALGTTGDSLVLGWSVVNAPPNALIAFALGSTNPNAAIPGLCSNLQTNLLSVMNFGTTNAAGELPLGGNGTWIIENHWDEQTLYTQFHVADLGRSSAIKITNSNGLRVRIPRSDLSRTLRTTRLWNEDSTTTSTRAVFQLSGVANYGLVTRFTY